MYNHKVFPAEWRINHLVSVVPKHPESHSSVTWLRVFLCFILVCPAAFINAHFLSKVSEVQMHESGSEPTSHTIPASHTENGNNTENESRLRSNQTPPPEAPRVSHFQLHLRNTSTLDCEVPHLFSQLIGCDNKSPVCSL